MFQKKILFILFCSTLYTTTQTSSFVELWPTQNNNAVISEPSWGRFGDTLLAFCHTLYFAYKNNCDFLYQPFTYSDQLVLDDICKKSSPEIEKAFKRKTIFCKTNDNPWLEKPSSDTLIQIPYFAESLNSPLFYTDWEDDFFKQLLINLIAPKKPLSLIPRPAEKISVAVHVRKGGTFESWSTESKHGSHLYKSPHNEFYIEQIQLLSQLLNHPPLYVFLFTDDENPATLAKLFEKAVKIKSITFDYRRNNNHHNTNVLEDFFSITQFDVLIRPDSNFSIMAEKIGSHEIVISPGEFQAGLQVQTGAIKIKNAQKFWHAKRPLALKSAT